MFHPYVSSYSKSSMFWSDEYLKNVSQIVDIPLIPDAFI